MAAEEAGAGSTDDGVKASEEGKGEEVPAAVQSLIDDYESDEEAPERAEEVVAAEAQQEPPEKPGGLSSAESAGPTFNLLGPPVVVSKRQPPVGSKWPGLVLRPLSRRLPRGFFDVRAAGPLLWVAEARSEPQEMPWGRQRGPFPI